MIEPQWSWKRMQDVKLMDRSVSQLQEYMDELGGCEYKYFLNRIVRAWDKPAAWLPQGTAVHAAIAEWELSGRTLTKDEVYEVHRREYRAGIHQMMEHTPNLEYWYPSYIYVGWQDIMRRAWKGFDQIDNYIAYAAKKPDELPWITPDGAKAIELSFKILLDKVRVQGYIDQVMGQGTFVVRDLKTGKKPGGTLQLKVYSIALQREFDLDVPEGDYFLLDKKKPTARYDLTLMSEGQVTDLFGRMNDGVKAESFEPSPDPDKCRMCGVKSLCAFSEA